MIDFFLRRRLITCFLSLLRMRFFLILFFVFFGVYYWFFFDPLYYFVIPVKIDGKSNAPLIQMEVAKRKYEVELDLGTELSSLSQHDLAEIDKNFCKTVSYFDVHGNVYQSAIYQISGIKIHDFFLSKMKIQEESSEFLANTVFVGEKDALPYAGRLGREVFKGKNFLMDFSQSKIIICKNFKDLEKDLYQLEGFTKVPFFVSKKSGICFQVGTDTGTKTLLLDSGAFLSFLRPSNAEEELSTQRHHGFPAWRSKKFIFGDRDFGEKTLHLFKISSLFSDIDGILGMDFLKEHAIYLDMGRLVAYIARSSSVATPYYSVIPIRIDSKRNIPLVEMEIANRKGVVA